MREKKFTRFYKGTYDTSDYTDKEICERVLKHEKAAFMEGWWAAR